MTSQATHQPQKYSKPYPEAHVKAMEAIMALPSGRPERWRATAAAWVNINQMQPEGLTAKQAYLAAADNVKDKRDNLVDQFAELKSTETARDSGMRESLEMPAELWSWIKMFDMDAFRTPADTRRNMKALREEFPEFSVAKY